MHSMVFASERQLIDHFMLQLASGLSAWQPVVLAREFNYNRGRADLVAVGADGTIIAFEAKLYRWRDALHQAYRNTCFAHRSYVVVPSVTGLSAQRYPAEFERRNVGLCAVSSEGFLVLHDALHRDPIQPWLAATASQHAAAARSENNTTPPALNCAAADSRTPCEINL
jgi:hypothetical protein